VPFQSFRHLDCQVNHEVTEEAWNFYESFAMFCLQDDLPQYAPTTPAGRPSVPTKSETNTASSAPAQPVPVPNVHADNGGSSSRNRVFHRKTATSTRTHPRQSPPSQLLLRRLSLLLYHQRRQCQFQCHHPQAASDKSPMFHLKSVTRRQRTKRKVTLILKAPQATTTQTRILLLLLGRRTKPSHTFGKI
jgi:hypothetical protein